MSFHVWSPQRTFWFAVCSLLFCLTSATAQTDRKDTAQVIGPMAGAITMKSAQIWAQVSAPDHQRFINVWLEYRALDGSSKADSPIQRSSVKRTDADKHWTADWLLNGLKPGTVYEYRVRWKNKQLEGSSQLAKFATQVHWPFRSDPPELRVLAGSCAYTNDESDDRPGKPYGHSNAIYQTMADRHADVTLWMGDNIYLREPDFGDEEAMSTRYDKWRALPELQPLLREGSHLATWDDHDYGPNDSNASHVHKDKTLKLFKRYWANPSYGLPGKHGVFTQHEVSDVAFFILDGRWYRDSDRWIGEDKVLFGPDQLRWLKNALLSSPATWKLIISGSQVLNLNNNYEGWNKFPQEMNSFMAWLDAQNLPGVMFLSGDRHFSTMLQLERPGNYPLYELTCSPLTAGSFSNPEMDLKDNKRIVQGTVVTTQNFCELDFTGPRKDRRMNISIKDTKGQVQWRRTVHENDLKRP